LWLIAFDRCHRTNGMFIGELNIFLKVHNVD
jgi:hypothetical protein